MTDDNQPTTKTTAQAGILPRLALGTVTVLAGASGALESGAGKVGDLFLEAAQTGATIVLPADHPLLANSTDWKSGLGITSAWGQVAPVVGGVLRVTGDRVLGCSALQVCAPAAVAKGSSMSGLAWFGIGFAAYCAADIGFEMGTMCDFAYNQAAKRGLKKGDLRIISSCDDKGNRDFKLVLSTKRNVLPAQIVALKEGGKEALYWVNPQTQEAKKIVQNRQEIEAATNSEHGWKGIDIDTIEEEFGMAMGKGVPHTRVMAQFKRMEAQLKRAGASGVVMKRDGGNREVDDPRATEVGSLELLASFTEEAFKPKDDSSWRRVQQSEDDVFTALMTQVAGAFEVPVKQMGVAFTPSKQTGWSTQLSVNFTPLKK